MTGSIAGVTPPGVHLLNSQGASHLDLQGRVIRYSLLKIGGDVQTLVFLKRRFNLMGVTVLTRRVIGLIVWHTSSGNECCGLMEQRLVPRGLTGGFRLTSWGTCTFSIQPPVPGHIGLCFLTASYICWDIRWPSLLAISESNTCLISSLTPFN